MHPPAKLASKWSGSYIAVSQAGQGGKGAERKLGSSDLSPHETPQTVVLRLNVYKSHREWSSKYCPLHIFQRLRFQGLGYILPLVALLMHTLWGL